MEQATSDPHSPQQHLGPGNHDVGARQGIGMCLQMQPDHSLGWSLRPLVMLMVQQDVGSCQEFDVGHILQKPGNDTKRRACNVQLLMPAQWVLLQQGPFVMTESMQA